MDSDGRSSNFSTDYSNVNLAASPGDINVIAEDDDDDIQFEFLDGGGVAQNTPSPVPPTEPLAPPAKERKMAEDSSKAATESLEMDPPPLIKKSTDEGLIPAPAPPADESNMSAPDPSQSGKIFARATPSPQPAAPSPGNVGIVVGNDTTGNAGNDTENASCENVQLGGPSAAGNTGVVRNDTGANGKIGVAVDGNSANVEITGSDTTVKVGNDNTSEAPDSLGAAISKTDSGKCSPVPYSLIESLKSGMGLEQGSRETPPIPPATNFEFLKDQQQQQPKMMQTDSMQANYESTTDLAPRLAGLETDLMDLPASPIHSDAGSLKMDAEPGSFQAHQIVFEFDDHSQSNTRLIAFWFKIES